MPCKARLSIAAAWLAMALIAPAASAQDSSHQSAAIAPTNSTVGGPTSGRNLPAERKQRVIETVNRENAQGGRKTQIDVRRYGPWAVIAGGSEGLGASYARKLGDVGFNLVLIARRPEPLENLAKTIREQDHVQVRTLSLDLSDPDMLAQVSRVTDDVDVGLLVYNAASNGQIGQFLDRPIDAVAKQVQLITVGETLLTHHFGQKMAARGRGGIIMVGTIAGLVGTSNVAAYSGAKAFTQIFGEALWAEMKPRGIDVLVPIVGAIDTPARHLSGTVMTSGIPPYQPDFVAVETLDNIANGPITVLSRFQDTFRELTPVISRRDLVERMRNTTVPAKKPGT